MKGITHFMSGVAVASCFPVAAEAIYASRGLLLPLGGIFGVMPDTLDFRIARYFWEFDHVVRLDEDNLDPKLAAEAVASAIDEAANSGRPVTLRLDIIRVSASFYRTYIVYVDEARKEVTCVIGPLKTMGQVMEKYAHMPSAAELKESIARDGVARTYERLFDQIPCLPESAPKENNHYTARFDADVANTYYRETEVGIFSGPDFAFEKRNGRIRIDFIPWHRRWTHSLTVAMLMGPVAFAMFAPWGNLAEGGLTALATPLSTTAFFIGIIAPWVHIFEDQLGHLGSNLLYPFTTHRTVGLKVSTAASPASNVMTNWIAFAVIAWNLNVHAPIPFFTMPWARSLSGGFADWTYYLVSLGNYALYAIAIPLLIFWYLLGDRRPSGETQLEDAETYGAAAYADQVDS